MEQIQYLVALHLLAVVAVVVMTEALVHQEVREAAGVALKILLRHQAVLELQAKD
jgi:hypothetical protein